MDTSALEAIVDEVIAANPDTWAKFAGGEGKAGGFLTGQVMKATSGKADGKAVNASSSPEGEALGASTEVSARDQASGSSPSPCAAGRRLGEKGDFSVLSRTSSSQPSPPLPEEREKRFEDAPLISVNSMAVAVSPECRPAMRLGFLVTISEVCIEANPR
jgi:hypothetical protein